MAFLTGVAGIFFDISGFAYVPSLVPERDLTAANRAVQGSSTVTDRLGFGRAFAVSLVLSCFAPLLLAIMPLRSASLAAIIGGVMLVAGIGLGNANVYSLTLRQTVIPRSLLARSGGAYRQVMYGSIPIGSALAGVVGELAGTRAGVLVGGVGLALSALPLFTPRIRALRNPQGGVVA